MSSLTEFELLEQQAAVEEQETSGSFLSPEAESMTHSESMSSGTASTVVEQGRDDDVQSQQTDRDIMGESLDEPDLHQNLSPRQPDIMTDSLDARSMTESFSTVHHSQHLGEAGISDVLMSDSLESEGLRRAMAGGNIMADSLVEEELRGHLEGGEGEIQIPPVEVVPENKGETLKLRRLLVTGHPTLKTVTFSSVDAMEEFLRDNQDQYPDLQLQVYESMEEHTENEVDDGEGAVSTTRIIKRRRSDLKETVETVTFTGTDSGHEMAKFLSRTLPLDYNETETIECETRDTATGDVTRMMTRRLSRVGQQSGGGSSRLLLRRGSSTASGSTPDIPEHSPNTDAAHAVGDDDADRGNAAHATGSLRQGDLWKHVFTAPFSSRPFYFLFFSHHRKRQWLCFFSHRKSFSRCSFLFLFFGLWSTAACKDCFLFSRG